MLRPDNVTSSNNYSHVNNNGQQQRSQPSYMLCNLTHPVFDGVDNKQPQHNAGTKSQRRQNNHNMNGNHIREWSSTMLRSNSEFTSAKNDKCRVEDVTSANLKEDIDMDENNNKDVKKKVSLDGGDHDVVGDNYNDDAKVKLEETDELNNQSDNENEEEFDENKDEIPTLENYVPREPNFDVANSLPFAELCRR